MKWLKSVNGESARLGIKGVWTVTVCVYYAKPLHEKGSNLPPYRAYIESWLVGNFDTLEQGKAEVEKRVRDSLEQIRKEIEECDI